MSQKKSIFFICFLVILLRGICFADIESGVKVNNIKYIFYTETVRKGTVSNEKLLQGKELENWPSHEYDVQPNVFDIVVEVKNTWLLPVKQPKLHIEFWLSEAPEIFNNESALDIGKMKKLERWVKNCEKDITLPDFKPLENRKIKIERVRIMELLGIENINKKVIVMGWKCRVVSGKSKFEKVFVSDFLD